MNLIVDGQKYLINHNDLVCLSVQGSIYIRAYDKVKIMLPENISNYLKAHHLIWTHSSLIPSVSLDPEANFTYWKFDLPAMRRLCVDRYYPKTGSPYHLKIRNKG